MTRKCILKCYHCQRIGHRVKDCTILKRKKNTPAGGARALETLVSLPVKGSQNTLVWDELLETTVLSINWNEEITSQEMSIN